MTAHLRAFAAGLGSLGVAVSCLGATPIGDAHAADDPPADVTTTVKTDAKAVGTAVKRDAKAVAAAAKEGAQQVAVAAKEVAHHVAAATKQGAHEVADAAKQGAAKAKAAVKAERADKAGGKPDGSSDAKADNKPAR
jgi:hypothetical protein